MPPKRKLANDTSIEEPAPKRTLRSSKAPQVIEPDPKPKRSRTRAPANPLASSSNPTRTNHSNTETKKESLEQPSNSKSKNGRRIRQNKPSDESSTNVNAENLEQNIQPPKKKPARQAKKRVVTGSSGCRGLGQVQTDGDECASQNAGHLQIPTVEIAKCLATQKLVVLQKLNTSALGPAEVGVSESINDTTSKQLLDLLRGTVERAEGNSCLILGPRGSGKSAILDEHLNTWSQNQVIVIRLCGWLQSTDRHALRELAIQLLHQTGTSLLSGLQDDEDSPQEVTGEDPDTMMNGVSLPPSSQLHSLIPVLSSLNRPVIVVLDGFDLFALHPRQSLLYCLLDAVQNCRASPENKGMAVIGMSSRIDTIQLLEKRVKSRFSGRTLRTGPPTTLDQWQTFARHMLLPKFEDATIPASWHIRWTSSVDAFLGDERVQRTFREAFSITRDLSILRRTLSHVVARLSQHRPILDFDGLQAAMKQQRQRLSHANLHSLSYPALCLLVAITHVESSGHTAFNFEMLLENFQDQVRSSSSAPVQVNGGSIGMMRCSREILMSAFESLVAARLLVSVNAATATTPKVFSKHRCVVEREDIKKAVEISGQSNLKKWLTKS
ncbi:hypothetical protein CVT24_004050 [Panaeolus cyanescens]|uniref:Uncharacterized protein n=1 Tax=Panaeolus cyanescens TaxID=181874 RepID=A0A409Y6G3_9AGAR|nr:hypothetical protein CVT24_004050 [Panaeolus cyanescens]